MSEERDTIAAEDAFVALVEERGRIVALTPRVEWGGGPGRYSVNAEHLITTGRVRGEWADGKLTITPKEGAP